MEKKRSWLSRLKRLFISEPRERTEKGTRGGWFLRRIKQSQSFPLPGPAKNDSIVRRRAEEEQSKHAVAVALATAAAAEAAVAAAHAAAEVVRLTGVPTTYTISQEAAAIKIQTAYRGCLARRALRALKGLVKLQALIRGEAVRRQMAITLRGLESLLRMQSQARGSLNPTELYHFDGQHYTPRKSSPTRQMKGGWDGSVQTVEEMEATRRSREEAAVKRVRALQYASTNYEKMNTKRLLSRDELDTFNQRWRWLEQWVVSQPFEKDIPESHSTPSRELNGSDHHASSRDSFACLDLYREEGEDDGCIARRSFTRSRRASVRDEDGVSCSPAFPGYMAFTASTKAKFRSMSTPKERVGASDILSEHGFTYTDRLSPIPSMASDAGASAKAGKPPVYNQRSPRLKGLPVPVQSRRPRNHRQSFDLESSLQNLERFTGPL